MLALNICWSRRCQYYLFKQSCSSFVFFRFIFKLWAWPDMSSLLQHLEEHQSKHQVGLTRRVFWWNRKSTSTNFLADLGDKLTQDGSCLEGMVNHASPWLIIVTTDSSCSESCVDWPFGSEKSQIQIFSYSFYTCNIPNRHKFRIRTDQLPGWSAERKIPCQCRHWPSCEMD